MFYDITLRIQEVTTGIRTEVDLRLDVNRAESGLYIAYNPQVSPVSASGQSPQSAILEYLGDLLYSTTVEAEMSVPAPE